LSTQIIATPTINLPKDHVLKVVKDTFTDISFIKIGNGRVNRKSKMKSIDLLKETETMTKSELVTINILKDNMVWETNPITGVLECKGVSYIPTKFFETKAKQLNFQKGMKLLKDKNLAKKISRGNYMLNPLAIIPSLTAEAIKLWGDDTALTKDSTEGEI
jgi:hypothetical protein